MPLIAATHLPIVATSGPLVGIGAMLVAAVTTVPLARLYEHGRRTIWAPAALHTAIDSFKLVTLPDEAIATFSLLLIGVSLIVPLAVLAGTRRGRSGWQGGARSLCARPKRCSIRTTGLRSRHWTNSSTERVKPSDIRSPRWKGIDSEAAASEHGR